ncbi:hypothetical protein [Spirillospora sp. NPDC047279]|uniref:hypothetical protein n=1 Tax=Spirillospora sp. NPDC047279 TaxID=3155478 RepID=UPI0033F837A2
MTGGLPSPSTGHQESSGAYASRDTGPLAGGSYGSGGGAYGARESGSHGGGGAYGSREGGSGGASGSYGAGESGSYGGGGAYVPGEGGSYGGSSAYAPGESGSYGGGSGTYASRESGAFGGSGAYGVRESGPYGTGGAYASRDSGSYGGSGGHPTGGGAGGSGGYPSRDSGGYPSRDSGSRRTGSGSHRRIENDKPPGRRWAFVLAGVVAGAACCVLAAFAIMSGVGVGEGEQSGGAVANSGASDSSPVSKGERSLVPDSCQLVSNELAGRLAPNADRTQADNYRNSDRQNQCVWGAYTGDRKRQLTVELRAIEASGDKSPTDAARASFDGERKADESGKALLAGQELTDKRALSGVGDDGYVVYSVDKGQGSGEAIANVRLGNVLVTIHYSGGNDGSPLGGDPAMNGAVDAAKAVVNGLNQG